MNLLDKFMQKYGRPPTEFDPDYLEMLNMSKYRILDIPDKKMAKCANCGSTKNDGRKYVDFGLEVDWYGIVFLCGKCMHDIAVNMGMFEYLKTKIATLEDRNKTLENLLVAQGDTIESKLANLMGEVTEYFAKLHSLVNDGRSDSSSVVDDNSSSGAENVTESDLQTATAKQRTPKPATSPGLKDISSLTELLKS